jgi:recombination protein RecT
MSDKPKIAQPRREAGRALADGAMLERMKTQQMIERFASYAPPGIDYHPLHASAVLAIAQEPKLQKAAPLMLVQTMMGVTRLGLEINSPLGHAYLIPFEMNGKVVIQVVIGYRGYIELAYRSGELIAIGGDVATMAEWEKKLFTFQKGTDAHLHHTFLPTRLEGEEEPAFAYAVAKMKDGEKFDVMPWAAIQRIKGGSQGFLYAKSQGEASKTFLKNPWVAHEWPMGVKTVLRRLTKTMRLTAALAQATALDEMGEEREIDFGAVVDLDPAQWRDMTDAGEKEREGKSGEQHQVKTPDAKPEAEKAKADATKKTETKPEPTGDPRDEPPQEGEIVKGGPKAGEQKQAAAEETRKPAAQAKANGSDDTADFWNVR